MTRRLALLVVFLVSACKLTTVPPLRDNEPMAAPIELAALENRMPVPGSECSDLLLRGTSVEWFVDRNGKEFNLGIIELSDDGHISNDEQKETVMKKLRKVALGGEGKSIDISKSPGAIIITFVHGWHHRSKVCDNNLACFRRVLQALSEASGKDGRPVFGVYVGWRGDTIEKKASFLSFYDRKATAHQIGAAAGREVLLELDRTYRQLNDRIKEGNPAWELGHPVTMVTAGHSFGGALVYSAVEGALVRELRKQDKRVPGSDHVVGGRPVDCGGQQVRPIRPGIGDLVVLVNPAFEARRYEFFVDDEKTKARYAEGQLPVLLTVASEGDSAVKVAFPAGRSLYFSAFPWRYRGLPDIIGMGHYDPHTTHDLVVTDDAGKIIHPPAAERPEVAKADKATLERCHLDPNAGDLATCKCEYDVPSNLAAAERGAALELDSGSVRITNNENISLRARKSDRDPHSPFIVARVSPSIISQHSDIYTPRFVTFLTSYIREFLEQVRKVKPGSMDDPYSPCTTAAIDATSSTSPSLPSPP
jgi:hypothetical protein